MRRLTAAVCLALCVAVNAAEPGGTLEAVADEPRAFGYHVGDLVVRHVTVHAPSGLQLDAGSLPRAGVRGRALELQTVSLRSDREPGGTRHDLRLTYQVFISPTEVRTLEIAPFVLRFNGEPRNQDLRVDAWPVTVAPLVPLEVSPRQGLGELQPDMPPPLLDTRPAQWRLAAYAGVLLLLLAYLAYVYLALPWWSQRKRPFALAWQHVRGLPARAALQRVHDALNQSAGEVVFEHGIDRFVAAQPRYAGLRDDLAIFFQHSRREFFGDGGAAADDSGWILEFCRKCRDAERGAA